MKNILVFPCGSEIALEIYKALQYSIHFKLIGGSSVEDHGSFVYKNYIKDIPFHNDKEFIPTLKKIIKEEKIDAIYPAMDLVAFTLKQQEKTLGCKIIGSKLETTEVCSNKEKMYKLLKNHLPTPVVYDNPQNTSYPTFIKPSVGYGSRNTFLAHTQNDATTFLEQNKDIGKLLLCEYLPFEEYTIDCFSNKEGELLFSQARQRARVSNGISVNTYHTNKHQKQFEAYARIINEKLRLRGAWFFQMKEDINKEVKLLEVASRLGGSSSLCRAKGVNFPLLTLFDAFDFDVNILENNYEVELDRALNTKFKINITYSTVYIDYDDCILLEDTINHEMISFIYHALNQKKKIVLITRHKGDLTLSLQQYRIQNLFDEIHHLTKKEKKSDFIDSLDAIFIDDSHQERVDVATKHNIPVFAPDMIEVLL